MNQMVAGAIAMGSAVIALFFLKYWRKTHDRFFLYFALSFALESLSRIYLTIISMDEGPLPYLARLVAYAFILVAIWEKNRSHASND